MNNVYLLCYKKVDERFEITEREDVHTATSVLRYVINFFCYIRTIIILALTTDKERCQSKNTWTIVVLMIVDLL